VLLTFGGTDPNNLTKKTLKAIYPYCVENNIKIKVITGLGYSLDESLYEFSNIQLFKNVPNISEYMAAADLVFTSAGRTTYEVALLGVPAIVLAQNERELTHFFAHEKNGFLNLGLGIEISHQAIFQNFQNLVNDYSKRKQMHGLMQKNEIKSGIQKVMKLINDKIDNYEYSKSN